MARPPVAEKTRIRHRTGASNPFFLSISVARLLMRVGIIRCACNRVPIVLLYYTSHNQSMPSQSMLLWYAAHSTFVRCLDAAFGLRVRGEVPATRMSAGLLWRAEINEVRQLLGEGSGTPLSCNLKSSVYSGSRLWRPRAKARGEGAACFPTTPSG